MEAHCCPVLHQDLVYLESDSVFRHDPNLQEVTLRRHRGMVEEEEEEEHKAADKIVGMVRDEVVAWEAVEENTRETRIQRLYPLHSTRKERRATVASME